MNATIGIYPTHDLAVAAIVKLKQAGYPADHLTLMGLMETEQLDDTTGIMEPMRMKGTGLEVGTIVGTTLGVLTGIGIFAIPGLGFLYGAGAIAGAMMGLDLGVMAGGVATGIATYLGLDKPIAQKYHDALAAGKFLVIAHGSEEEVKKGEQLLQDLGGHDELAAH